MKLMKITIYAILISATIPSAVYADLVGELSGPAAGGHQGVIFNIGASNTMEGFRDAIKQKVDILETDLQVTKDGKVIISHDSDLKGSGICSGEISEKNYEEMKDCKNSFGKPIPTFDDVIELAREKNVIVNAEFKTREVVVPAVQNAVAKNALGFVFFQTKNDPRRYEAARAVNRHVYLLYKIDNEEDLDWAISLNDDYLRVIELEENLLRPEIIQKIHASGKLALTDTWRYIWHKETMGAACAKVFKRGIDIAITNSPRSCAKQRDKFRKK